jgi:hypothetical protein
MGMYGMIVVRAAGGAKTAWTGGPAFDKDYKWLMSDVDSVWHYHLPVHDTVMDTLHIPKYSPNYFLINGKCGSEINSDDSIQVTGAQGEKILMRLANIGYLTNRVVFPSWLNAQIIDSDGRPLPNAIVNDTCFIMPGERFSVMLQPNTQTTGFINVCYIDMNTGLVTNTNPVPVNINGMIGIPENTGNLQVISLFPNPVSYELNLKVNNNSAEKYFVRIIDPLGQEIKSFSLTNEATIATEEFSNGLYIILIYNAINQKIQSLNFIKVN